jgi:hypothetical protein
MKCFFLLRKGNWISAALVLFLLSSSYSYAQEVYARVLYSKVEPQNVESYLKLVKESIKPLLQQAKKNGEISDWALFQVHNTGSTDEYNYCSVLYYDSWTKTEKLPNLDALVKQVNPKSTAPSLYVSLNNLRKNVKIELYSRVDLVGGSPTTKYFVLNFMKPAPGLADEYIRIEKEIWNPMHKELVNTGIRTSWALWQLVFPGGSSLPYNYATSDGFADYAKMNEGDFMAIFKKVHPDKKVEEVADRTSKSRQLVRSELWERIDMIDAAKVASN